MIAPDRRQQIRQATPELAPPNLRSVAAFPWLIIPALFVVVAVLAFNFLGDGLRDAADPYK